MALIRIPAFLAVAARGDFGFIAVGDWGGENDQHPVTDSQRQTGEAMMRTADELGTDFTLMMGDNFYTHGVGCNAEASPRFGQTFEDVYAKQSRKQPFYIMAGNHDYGQDKLANLSAQLAYSALSTQWNFPALWYTLRRNFTAGGKARTFKLIVIDTVSLCGNPRNEDFIDIQLEAILGEPRDMARPGDLRQKVAERQWSWLEEELEEGSGVDYLWVSGHYPIYSAGKDGSSKCLVDRLLPLLQKHYAHYISGHDHNLQHFVDGDVNAFVLGAGKECCYFPTHRFSVPFFSLRFLIAGKNGWWGRYPRTSPVLGGYASLSFAAEHVTVTIHQHDGAPLHAVDISRIRVPGSTAWPWGVGLAAVAMVLALAGLACLVCITGVSLGVRRYRRRVRPALDAASQEMVAQAPELGNLNSDDWHASAD